MRFIFVIALVALSACTTSQESGQKGPSAPVSGEPVPTSGETVTLLPDEVSFEEPADVLNLTPHIRVLRGNPGKTISFWDDTYTRVRVSSDSSGNTPRNYADERRSAFSRLFVGKTISANLTFKVGVLGGRPAYSATIPVVAMSHASSKDAGEQWSTDVYGQSINKLVRVRSGSRIVLSVELARSVSSDSRVVQSALNVAREATKAIAPQSDLLTTFTKSSVDKEAQIWDSALSKLFGVSISEQVLSDSLLSEVVPDTSIASVNLLLPKNISDFGMDNALQVGEWRVSLDCPTRSLFIPQNIVEVTDNGKPKLECQPQPTDSLIGFKLSPERVLGYPISENATIYSYLLSSTGFSDHLQNVAASSGQEVTREAQKMCSAILSVGEELGLTRVDSNLLVWAVSQRFPIADKATEVQTACSDSKKTVPILMEFSNSATVPPNTAPDGG